MKKVALFFAVTFVAAMMFSSCSKDYTCACEWEMMDEKMTQDYVYEGVKKADAEETCDAQQVAVRIIDPNGKCELK